MGFRSRPVTDRDNFKHKMSDRRKDRKTFSRTADQTNKENVKRFPVRGGYRL